MFCYNKQQDNHACIMYREESTEQANRWLFQVNFVLNIFNSKRNDRKLNKSNYNYINNIIVKKIEI